MNREILFRGKRVDSEEWIEGYYVPCSFGSWPCRPAIVNKADLENGTWHYEEVSPSTVCEFTGLTDKNEQKIFEGDILHENYHSEHDKIVFLGDAYFGWKFIYAQEVCDAGSEDCVCLRQQVASYYRVIGNIFDNPELLEGKNK